ncbi:MAG: hypothetical protein IIZ38_08880 [Sphingomonas sp.]|uniref:hypothetical protein n=1 Tax=Sphingomonas sp. TaxID=28214 RepID=UPI0025F9EACE|nr:hypothetical protein [Sphingomonas sp.]MBQ1498416.1 hypothetical protein [Sphingomonas sp.]
MRDAENFREAFLYANANRDFISSELADVLRYLVRAMVADDPSSSLSGAAQKMSFVEDLLQRCQEPLTWYDLFQASVDDIRNGIPDDADEWRYIRAAKKGTKYLVEGSARDNLAAARASKAFDAFRNAIKWSDEARKHRSEF